MKRKTVLLFILLIANAVVWHRVIFPDIIKNPEIYFLDVGQGDSELIILPNNVKILIDGGPNNKVLGNLDNILPPSDRYIDLAVLSHPESDHFGGLIEIFKRYKVGTFAYNGINRQTAAFQELKKIAEENKIPTVALGEKDKIKYLDSKFDVLSPSKEFLSLKELNESSLVLRFESNGASALFTGDIGEKTEKYLAENYDLKTDILKVGHHGSKYSSVAEFIKETTPKISVIEVGKNSYGHPTPAVLDRLANVGSQIFRTDKDGTVKIVLEPKKLNIFAQR